MDGSVFDLLEDIEELQGANVPPETNQNNNDLFVTTASANSVWDLENISDNDLLFVENAEIAVNIVIGNMILAKE